MRLLTTISIFIVWSLGLIQPDVWSHSFDLHKMYEQCSYEDPDINPLDFVLEHLLNLEDVFEHIEGESSEFEDGELPHQPYQVTQSATTFFVAIPQQHIEMALPFNEQSEAITYPIKGTGFYCCDFNSGIFRPPIV